MIIKKMLLLGLVVVLFSSLSFAGIKSYGNEELVNSEQSNSPEFKKVNIKRELAKAKNAYFQGDLEKAEQYIDIILNVSSDNLKATELKNKILVLREKISFFKKAVVSDYAIELKRAVKDGNCYEGFLFIKKINSLIPEEDVTSYYLRLSDEKDLIASTIENENDKKEFLNSIEYFKDGKFLKASRLISKLSKKYPKFEDFVGMSRCYILQETSTKRISMYYKEALKNIKYNRYGKAKDCIELGYILQPENIKLITLMEQINMELM
ncbi:MAG: hypothetical protein PHG84_03215 [Endomicrobiaceae bacterium]|nr:hypothetical protein [Endomicrobiaceae bacterium]MDD3922420.1 hypothetical protein [Endomicrobiaceae bacterium]